MIQAMDASRARRVVSAKVSPICLARFCWSAGNRAGEDRDEYQVVDAEHDLEGGQCQEARPDLRIEYPIHMDACP